MKRVISLLVLFSFTGPVLADSTIDDYFYLLGFKLEESTIQNVIDSLGEAGIHREGDAASSYTGVCYQNSKLETTVYFESGEMGGTYKRLLSFQVHSKPVRDYPCGVLTDEMAKKLSIGNLKLGSEIDKVVSSLPQNTYAKDNLTFSYLKKIPFTEEEIEKFEVKRKEYAFWDQFSQIDIFTENTKVSGYSVSKVTSW
ncbi:MAG: hypothetical protein ABW166_02235 [Sedimenticola sp.]